MPVSVYVATPRCLEGIIPPEEGTVEVVLDDLGRRAGSPLPSNGVLTVGEASGFAAWSDNLLAGVLGVAVLLVLWRVLATSGGGDAPADSSFLEELDLDITSKLGNSPSSGL